MNANNQVISADEIIISTKHTKESKLKHLSYKAYLDEIQKYLSNNYASVLSDTSKKPMLKDYITKFKNDHRYIVDDVNDSELVDLLYRDMAEYSVLTDYLKDGRTDIEEININSWDDIAISYDNGDIVKLKDHFYSPQHCTDVIKRILQESKMTLDMSKPYVRGFIGTNKRVSVTAYPIVDPDVSISASIRIINPKHLTKSDFLKGETTTDEILEFLITLFKHKISMCIAGETGSGKTTLMSLILELVSEREPTKRIITIEEEVREFNLIKRDDNGKILNNVVHMVTRKSDNEKETISSEMLLEMSLTMDPDIICLAEMKSSEAFAAQEAARTGHTVIGTTHAKDAIAIYDRLCTLCYRKHQIDYSILNKLVNNAFPIAIFEEKMNDKKRRITEIVESVLQPDGSSKYNVLYRFITEKNIYNDNGECEVIGHFSKVNSISDSLKERLIKNGINETELEKII